MAVASTPPPEAVQPDVRPRIRLATRSGHEVWLFVIGLAVAAVVLFTTLEARRTAADLSNNQTADSTAARIASPPELYLPPDGLEAQQQPLIVPAPSQVVAPTAVPAPGSASRNVAARSPGGFPMQPAPVPYVPPIQQPVYVAPIPSAPLNYPAQSGPGRQDRVSAYQFANPGTTVPKGTIIQAVLETALDSTRPGFARALVSRDISSFDGRRVLIPRGSRLIGDYATDLAAGQNRILIQWQRLMRPDGVTVDLASPSSDSLGRAGVKGTVDSHFIERLGDAFLQSLVSIGPQLALRSSRTAVVYAVPLTNQLSPVTGGDRVQRTLRLKPGSSVSVFVAKDLDFSTVAP